MKIKAGIIAAVPNAAILSQAVPVEVTNDVETTGIVLSPVCVSIKTKINSVQLKIKQRTAVAAMPPIARGTINRQNTKNLVAPVVFKKQYLGYLGLETYMLPPGLEEMVF